jgi:chaperonin GroES
MTIKPLGDRVVVKPADEEKKTVAGLIIPDSAKERPQEGEIVAVGSGRNDGANKIPLEVKVGDKVIFSKYGGTEITYDDQDYLILSESDILAIV